MKKIISIFAFTLIYIYNKNTANFIFDFKKIPQKFIYTINFCSKFLRANNITRVDIINNRELSILIWCFLLLIVVFSKSDLRKNLLNALKVTFAKKLIFIYIFIILNSILCIYILDLLGLNELYLLKYSIKWIILFGFISTGKAITKGKNISFFINNVKTNFSFMVLILFIVNYYTNSLLVEFIAVPIISFVTFIKVYIDFHKESYKQLIPIFENIYSGIGIIIIINTIYLVLNNVSDFLTIKTIKIFLIPILAAILFIPFNYIMAIISSYEQIFIPLKIKKNLSFLFKNYIKIKIYIYCGFSLDKINHFAVTFKKRIWTINNKNDFLNMLNNYQKDKLSNIKSIDLDGIYYNDAGARYEINNNCVNFFDNENNKLSSDNLLKIESTEKKKVFLFEFIDKSGKYKLIVNGIELIYEPLNDKYTKSIFTKT